MTDAFNDIPPTDFDDIEIQREEDDIEGLSPRAPIKLDVPDDEE